MIVSFAILFGSSSHHPKPENLTTQGVSTTTTILPHKWQHPSSQLSIARQRKVEAIDIHQRPTNEKQLKSYLGMASYYRKFIPNFSRIAAPLYALLKASVY
jgi:hypothetical protein